MNKLDELNQELQRKNLVGFWTIGRGTDYEAYEPASPFEPCIWKWSDVAGALNKAGETLSLNESFRRVVVFNTPSLRYTTQTLFLGAQLVKPGEIAEAHRHTMGAIRFVVQGGGAQTTVNGEPFPMESGDLITTPSLTWHDHYNGSNQPIIWLDGADGPFVRYLGIGFGKRFDQRQQTHYRSVESSAYELAPARPNWISANPLQPAPYRYSWESTERTLEALGERPGDPYDGLLLRYVHPITGGPTLPTLSCEIQMLRPGETTKSHRHTSNSVYHVFKGNGFTVIDNAKYEWNTGDTFALPLWRWHHHGNSSSEETILFVINDRPIMEAFGFYREDTNGGNT
jgi:1-hydroxy-2-naphthoate dioxygenase